MSSPITLVLLLIPSCLARSHPQYFPASSVQVISHIVYSRPFFINLTKNVIPAAAGRRMRDMWPLAKARLLVTTLSLLTPLPPSKSIALLFPTHTDGDDHRCHLCPLRTTHHHHHHCRDFRVLLVLTHAVTSPHVY